MTPCPKCGADNLASFSYEITTIGQMPVKKAGRHCSKCGYRDGDWDDIAQDRPTKILIRAIEAPNRKQKSRLPSKQDVKFWLPILIVGLGVSMLVLNGGTSLYGLIGLILGWGLYFLNSMRAD